jgi:hypothetical protein
MMPASCPAAVLPAHIVCSCRWLFVDVGCVLGVRCEARTCVVALLCCQLGDQHWRVVAGSLGATHATWRSAVEVLLNNQVDWRQLTTLQTQQHKQQPKQVNG